MVSSSHCDNMEQLISFTARTIRGSGRGRDLGVPTINLDLRDISKDLKEGIYACFVQGLPAVMHYGPRPVFRDTPSCEIHLLDADIHSPPPEVTVEIVTRLRDVRDFPSEEALKAQIDLDIDKARRIFSL